MCVSLTDVLAFAALSLHVERIEKQIGESYKWFWPWASLLFDDCLIFHFQSLHHSFRESFFSLCVCVLLVSLRRHRHCRFLWTAFFWVHWKCEGVCTMFGCRNSRPTTCNQILHRFSIFLYSISNQFWFWYIIVCIQSYCHWCCWTLCVVNGFYCCHFLRFKIIHSDTNTSNDRANARSHNMYTVEISDFFSRIEVRSRGQWHGVHGFALLVMSIVDFPFVFTYTKLSLPISLDTSIKSVINLTKEVHLCFCHIFFLHLISLRLFHRPTFNRKEIKNSTTIASKQSRCAKPLEIELTSVRE